MTVALPVEGEGSSSGNINDLSTSDVGQTLPSDWAGGGSGLDVLLIDVEGWDLSVLETLQLETLTDPTLRKDAVSGTTVLMCYDYPLSVVICIGISMDYFLRIAASERSG